MEPARLAEHDPKRSARPHRDSTDFDGRFDVFAIVLFSILLLVGTLTLLRVSNVSDVALASAVAGSSYFVAWLWRYVRRFRAMQHDYKALFPHAAE